MLHVYHFVSHANRSISPFRHRELCADFWHRIRRRFPRTLGCVLMPDHLHLLIAASRPKLVKQELCFELRAFTRTHFPGQKLWHPTPAGAPVPDSRHLKRVLRYIHLNPCRSGLVQDPLQWEWSTHRDLCGLVQLPWLDLNGLAVRLKIPPARLAENLHAYISGDPTVCVSGTPVPAPPEVHQVISASLSKVSQAVAAYLREDLRALTSRGPARTMAVQLALHLGFVRKMIESHFQISMPSIKRAASAEIAPQHSNALRTLLADPRLLPVPSQRP